MILPVSALQQSAAPMIYELKLGETQTLEWKLISDSSQNMLIKLTGLREGSQLLSFPSEIELPAKKSVTIPITVSVPADFEDNIILKPKIRALAEGVAGSSATKINIAMGKILQIKIGDNPIEKIVEAPPLITEPESTPETIPKPLSKSQFIIGAGETQKLDTKEPTMIPEPIAEPTMQCGKGAELVDGYCKVITQQEEGGSCLIATAAYGTELAPQVQFLREVRDNTVLSTPVGVAFMGSFNTLYYSFAPTVADWERENPSFQDAVRLYITPMISTLSIMSLADSGNDAQVFGLGIAVIALNLAMYIGIPVGTVFFIRQPLNHILN